MSFVHLHSHTHYSLLDGAGRIPDMVKKAARLKMPGLAITDHGNMFGAIEFYKACQKAGIKPIIGIEAYITQGDHLVKKKGLGKRDTAHLILMAKDMDGLNNLFHLSSMAYLEGFYRRPRIDYAMLREHHQGLIATSACLNGEIALAMRDDNRDEAIKKAEWYLETFGDDFYLEIQDHGIPGEKEVYDRIYKLGKEMKIPVIATNDNHYLEREHWESHDILLCLQTGKDLDDPKRMRYNTTELYLKDTDEMFKIFKDRPETMENTMAIFEKINLDIPLGRRLLPEFPIPLSEGNISLDDYLAKLANEGLRTRYKEVTPDLQKRLDYELSVIKTMGFAGYFLIVVDVIAAARKKNIPVGLGRGSAAGSIVAYSLEITGVDPIKYNLLFERFLNPERVNMPDIDIDFCYERRDEIIEYVRNKYGQNNVAQIITFGTMAPRNALKDVARILKINFDESNKLSQLIPVVEGKLMPLAKAFEDVPDLKALKKSANPVYQKLVKHSQVLEGIARQPGIHPAGVIIAPDDIKKYVPLYKNSDGDITTQFSMNYLEEMGLLKMDFLGLRTLTVIDKTVKMIREIYGIEIDPLEFPLDDKETFELFSNAQTTGIFQFESNGMKDYLSKLKPTRIQDLIAMNALYRPGPMRFIDSFIKRKYGKEEIIYLHPQLEHILDETYGIMVYQEQVMQIVHDLAGFTLGQADLMRRAMGKKKIQIMEELKGEFVSGCIKNNIDEKLAHEIFNSILEFARYGFNKSHSAAYALIAYQTAYLKAHYPAEFMSATMTSEINQTERIQLYMEEAKHLGLKVLAPDINHSHNDFKPIDKETISYGMEAIKNVGSKPISSIVSGREKEGNYKSIFDFVEHVDLRLVNRKVLESLIQAGAMDSLEGTRAQNFAAVDTALEFGSKIQYEQGDKEQTSIFSIDGEDASKSLINYPVLPEVPAWDKTEMLKREFALLGFYLTGHPLEDYERIISAYANLDLKNLDKYYENQIIRAGGIIINSKNYIPDNNKEMMFLTVEDFEGQFEVTVFSELLYKKRDILKNGNAVLIIGRIREKENRLKLVAEDIFPLTEAVVRLSGGLRINLSLDDFDERKLQQMKTLFEMNHRENGIPVYVSIEIEEQVVNLMMQKYRIQPDKRIIMDLEKIVGNQNVILLPSKNNGKY